MASRLLNPSLFHIRAPLFLTTFGLSSALLTYNAYYRRPAYLLDSSPTPVRDWSLGQYQSEAKTPVIGRNGGLNAKAVRQMSMGSILGLVAGLGISIFSKPLALLLGLAIIGVQTAESYGVHLVPYKRIQGYFGNVDVRSAVQDNAAFKLSFGTLFALSAFAEF